MEYTTLGRTGLKVSRLCLGTMNFGPETTPEDSFVIMDRALELGINFFDTADIYGWKPNQGWTEQIIGDWFAQGGHRREKVVLATKCFNPMGQGPLEDWPNTQGLSARHIRQACDASLQRLKTDYIDLYQMHHVDRSCPWEEIWQAMEVLVQQGKVLYVGSSNFGGWHIAQANEQARGRNFMGLVSEQSKYSLAQREIEMEVVPACQAYGMGILPWSPLGGGLLGGVLQKIESGRRAGEWVQEALKTKRPQVERWEKFASDKGEPPARLALAWTARQPGVTAPIIGPRTLEQLDDAPKALEVTLSEEDYATIGDIWPGFKTSPEHYAW